ncbi:hypothetical protein [Phenylobacterium sp.]|uniref:hypothetical protein n=1 Tax=Phenylobacterium sp. TaxID=1871053 RepID=UPI00286A9A85|nr:hypothetical protein [Phenylobacterium sp.]
MPGFIHQVEMKLASDDERERLRRIDSWCGDWQIGFRVLDRRPGCETIRIAFEDPRLARAFVGHFGGVLVDDREVEDALAGDAVNEDAYDRRAKDYAE